MTPSALINSLHSELKGSPQWPNTANSPPIQVPARPFASVIRRDQTEDKDRTEEEKEERKEEKMRERIQRGSKRDREFLLFVSSFI